MKFIFADSLDYVDPRYDFIADRSPANREPYWDDLYPHEILGHAPYDGILVSRGVVDRKAGSGRYTETQARRFRMVGAREFLRFRRDKYPGSLMFGDCGAFAYHKESVPPYSPEEMAEFYDDGGFTHGCSVDHIIFEFDSNLSGMSGGSAQAHERYELTLSNAEKFLRACRQMRNHFTPMGVVQGWSPDSMAEAARRLQAMGYTYLALGGMVQLKAPAIHACLDAIRGAVGKSMQIHLLGFAKAEQIHEFVRHGISSFDTTSPLLRAFTDARANYFLPGEENSLRYFTAIRIPQALQNAKLLRGIKSGALSSERLVQQERHALDSIRSFDRGQTTIDAAVDAAITYADAMEYDASPHAREKKRSALKAMYVKTLTHKPWKQCDCSICREVSVEVIIFRSSNRNKRRGIHNLEIFGRHVQSMKERNAHA